LTPEEKQSVQVLAVSCDNHAESELMIKEIEPYPGPMDFPLLQDKDHRTISRYGIYNPAEFKAGIPYPAVFIIDKEGVVVERLLDAETLSRATNFQIREALQRIRS
jgi:alkyl hydroperoxide reductase subunit AhpC